MYTHLDESILATIFCCFFLFLHTLKTKSGQTILILIADCLTQATAVWRLSSCCCWLWLWPPPHHSDQLTGQWEDTSKRAGSKRNPVWDNNVFLWWTHRPDSVLPVGTVQTSGLKGETQEERAKALRVVPFNSEVKHLNLEVLKHRYKECLPRLWLKIIAWEK